MERTLPTPLTNERLRLIAAALWFSVALIQYGALFREHPWITVVWLAPIITLVMSRQALIGGIAMATASMLLRIGYIGTGSADQIAVSQAAFARVIQGLSPYGHAYAESIPAGSPYPYGPLGIVWWLPGPAIEFVAVALILAVLVWQRAWLTLAIFGTWDFVVYLTGAGINDYSPALLILLAVIAVRTKPILGAVLLAIASALKPYAFAWAIPMIGFGGMPTLAAFGAATAILWSPLLLWGASGFTWSLEKATALHAMQSGGWNLPWLRYLVPPISVAGLILRSWTAMTLLGAATLILFMFSAPWASAGYWIPVMPVVGLVLEQTLALRRSWVVDPHRLKPDAGTVVGAVGG